MSLRSDIQSLANEFDAEDNAAVDLWSWLPSRKIAEKYHGDCADNVRPSIESLMTEATIVLAEKAGYPPSEETRREWSECPCGEGHDESEVSP